MLQTMVGRLVDSASSPLKHAGALLMAPDDARAPLRLQWYTRLVAERPTDPVVAWHAMLACADAGDDARCPLEAWEAHLLSIDSQNGAAWAQVAANRYRAGDRDGALAALQRAGQSPRLTIYAVETLRLVTFALDSVGDWPLTIRALHAETALSRQMISVGHVTSMCTAQAGSGEAWANACLAYADRLASLGKTPTEAASAFAIRRAVYRALGDSGESLRAEAELVAVNNPAVPNRHYLRFLFLDEGYYQAFLSAFEQEGRIAARRQMADVIRRDLEARPELACRLLAR